MYCRNCGKEIAEAAVACPHCGADPRAGNKFCWNCGTPTDPRAIVCPQCGVSLTRLAPVEERKDWLVALLLSIFLGELGIDRFYLGYTVLGILKLLTAGGCGIWYLIDLILIAMNKLPDADGNPLVKR